MAHPVLEQQQVMSEGVGAASAAPPESDALSFADFGSGEWWSKRVPNTVAAMAVGSVLTLVLLRMAGFRFSFGVNVGGG